MAIAAQASNAASVQSPAPADIRNILLCGHGGAGKTTLTERLLFASGAIKAMGSVEKGDTVSDFSEAEKHHKHSLTSSIVHFEFEGHHVNLIDTPGLGDFIGHAIAAFPAVETVAVVVDASRGVESGARRLMKVAGERKIPRVIIVNKIDHPDADLPDLLGQLRSAFGPICLPINLPTGGGRRVVNVFEHAGNDAAGDEADFSSVHEAHKDIVEQIVEVDEALMGEYLERGDAITPAELHGVFEKALEQAHLVPIAFCSARTGAGIDDLLHVFASLCPSPVEVNPPEFVRRAEAGGAEEEWHAEPDPAAKVLAHVFKVTTDPFVGKLSVFRVHQGTVRTRSELLLDEGKKPIRIGHMFKLQGKGHVEVSQLGPGEIGAVAKIDEIHAGGVLHDSHELDSVHLNPLPLSRPMFGLAVELKNHADEAKFSSAVHKLCEEDPCLRMDRIAATKQTVLRGMGELHLRVVLERLKGEFGVDVSTAPPKVAYKETITAAADGHHRHKKQTGGSGQFGEVFLKVEPLPADHPEGFEFINDTVGGSVPRQFMPAIEKGVRQALVEGAIAGYPMRGIAVRVYDGKTHAVDSKEIAFVTAGRKAFIDGVQKARPVLLEPFVTLEITAPSECIGDITGGLSGKRGRVLDTEIAGDGNCIIRAVAPLGELQTFSNELKSITGGRGSYVMEYSHDERAPAHIQEEVVAAFKPREDD